MLRPLKVVIENYPEGQIEELEAVNHPDDPAAGSRRIRFGRELYVERDDFMENPPKKFFRLSPGREVRLRYAYFITCREAVKNAAGEVVELRCTYDPATRGGNAPDGRKVQATSALGLRRPTRAGRVRLYNPLFARPDPTPPISPPTSTRNSLEVLKAPSSAPAHAGPQARRAVQFERQGYFCRDPDSAPGRQLGVQPHGRPARHLGEGRRCWAARPRIRRSENCLHRRGSENHPRTDRSGYRRFRPRGYNLCPPMIPREER